MVVGTGVLLPISSLPSGRFKDGYRFVDWLVDNKYKYWQILPLNPRDSLGSPYNSKDITGIDPAYGTRNEWFKLKKYANNKGIKIIGDLPFFVPGDSLEARKHPEFFDFRHKSGAPPDKFRKNGQRWGHPQYSWEAIEKNGFKLFLSRFKWTIKMFDLVRLDHFSGYEAVWILPDKKWVKVPGEKLFTVAKKHFGQLPFIAEDLGVITPSVEQLRKKFHFLGSAVVQFGENNNKDIVYYSSTHDTDTLRGHYGRNWEKYLDKVLKADAQIKIVPMWDILGLDNRARFNRPGTKKGNWKWRLRQI